MEIDETLRASDIEHIIRGDNEYMRTGDKVEKIMDINLEKEKYPTMQLLSCNFSIETRIARLEFRQLQEYRTIERYVTSNYVKTPIYSYWKIKEKLIRKSIKLTNAELENLQQSSDALIAIFAYQIVSALRAPELRPSWYLHKMYLDEYNNYLKNLIGETERYKDSQYNLVRECKYKIEDINNKLSLHQKSLSKNTNIKSRIENKIDKAKNLPKSINKSIFSFGIYNFLRSQSRIVKLENKLNIIISKITNCDNDISSCKKDISKLNKNIAIYKDNIANKEKELDTKRSKGYNELAKKVRTIKLLPSSIEESKEFTPLKQFNGLKAEKFIGCYVIHNVKNDKCYVGQSKDVPKRIRQHFTGTVPKNIIFAEDYYSTPIDERDSLFEIKIVACTTKDELDSTEKQLIEDYDAFRSGYNGTGGNS